MSSLGRNAKPIRGGVIFQLWQFVTPSFSSKNEVLWVLKEWKWKS